MQNTMTYSIQSKNFTEKTNNPNSEMINILMVDDLKENLVALEAVLSSPNYRLVMARSGEEALKYILKQDFAVILLDVQMPGLNGFETAKLIKARKRSKDIPIIFITAISQDMEHVLHGYSVGAIDYIFKPFNPETLKQKVAQFVEIYKSHTESLKHSELKKSIELEQVNLELNRTTVDLYKTEALSKVVGETLLDTIVTFDGSGVILSVNPMVQKMFGYEVEELFGKQLATILPAVKLESNSDRMFPLSIHSITKSSTGKILEGVALRKDQGRFPVDIQIGKATIENSPLFVCTIRDVTERKEMEKIKNQQFDFLKKIVEERTLDLLSANEKLKAEIIERKKVADDLFVSHERSKKIFDASPCLMAIRSIHNGRFVDVNKAWLKSTGYEYEEVIDQVFDWSLFIEGIKVDLADPKLNEGLSNLKVTYQSKNGAKRCGLLSTEIIEIHDETCVLILVNDITEREHLEKEMLRLDRLNLIGEMAAGIAHEIRNPMTTVHGFLQMWKINDQHLSHEIVDIMLDELNRANDIIKEFLTLAKNKANYKTEQSLNRIIEPILPLLNAEANLAGKRVEHHFEPCPELLLDEKEIRQLFLNLSLNGLEAMDHGGILTVRTYSEEEKVILEVKDAGTGIKPDIIDKIGTPFFTTKEHGTGMGLAICYSIAERHHAKIKVKTGNEGTSFSIYFNHGSMKKKRLNGEKQ